MQDKAYGEIWNSEEWKKANTIYTTNHDDESARQQTLVSLYPLTCARRDPPAIANAPRLF